MILEELDHHDLGGTSLLKTRLSKTSANHNSPLGVPIGSPSRCGDVAVYVSDINQSSSHAPFYSVLVTISVSMALSTVLDSINSRDKSLQSHFVLPLLFLPYWSFQLSISL